MYLLLSRTLFHPRKSYLSSFHFYRFFESKFNVVLPRSLQNFENKLFLCRQTTNPLDCTLLVQWYCVNNLTLFLLKLPDTNFDRGKISMLLSSTKLGQDVQNTVPGESLTRSSANNTRDGYFSLFGGRMQQERLLDAAGFSISERRNKCWMKPTVIG